MVESTAFPATRSPELAITDWEIGELETETSVFTPLPTVDLSSLTVRVGARRMIGYYIVQMLIPLILIVGMSWAVFWIDPKVIPTRMSVCVTTVLTLIAYRFMVGGLVPKLPYLTLVDYLLLGSTLLVAGSFVVVTAGTYLVSRDRGASVTGIDRIARIVFPACFVVLVASLGLFG